VARSRRLAAGDSRDSSPDFTATQARRFHFNITLYTRCAALPSWQDSFLAKEMRPSFGRRLRRWRVCKPVYLKLVGLNMLGKESLCRPL
jgi:hypothetical protein